MQRQSLGSPGSKHHHHHNNNNGGSSRDDSACVSKADDRRDSLSTSSSSSSPSPIVVVADEEEMKFEKAIRSGSNVRMERIVHAIPILTLLCFLVLYLCSHEPSDLGSTILSQFGGLKPALKPIEFGVDSSNEMDDIIGGYLGKESGAGEVLGIRSHRNLQEIVKENPKPRSNRKFGDF